MIAEIADQERTQIPTNSSAIRWNYEEAFSRNIGLITAEEQDRLRRSCVAIAGMGGVGGVHLITLARTGVGNFTIADPDSFELANMNRQYGARVDTVGRLKVEVMAEEVRRINPGAALRAFDEPIREENIDQFLEGVEVVVDGLDYFAIRARRQLFREAYRRGLWVLTSGPHAFGATLLCFSPDGMSFDDYFDIHDGMSEEDQLIAFGVGGCPRHIHLSYLDFKKFFSFAERRSASAGLACQLASGLVAAEAVKILLGRGRVRAAPCYLQFDAYRQKLVKGRLVGANRHPAQQLKRWWLRRQREAQKARIATVKMG